MTDAIQPLPVPERDVVEAFYAELPHRAVEARSSAFRRTPWPASTPADS